VYKIGETGREITLYRFGLGESCVVITHKYSRQKGRDAKKQKTRSWQW
jgi:hypothetical protein